MKIALSVEKASFHKIVPGYTRFPDSLQPPKERSHTYHIYILLPLSLKGLHVLLCETLQNLPSPNLGGRGVGKGLYLL